MIWDQNSPVNEVDKVWVRNHSSIKDAEEGAVFGCGVLAGRREELLETSRLCLDLIGVVRIVKVHGGPHLPKTSASDPLSRRRRLTNVSQL